MTEPEFDPVIARLLCGELTRQLREVAQIDPGTAERRLRELSSNFYATKLPKIESGVIGPSETDVRAMISLYDVTVERAEQLKALARDARRRAKPGKAAGARDHLYLSLERHASEIRMAYNEIPGLAQTQEYAYAALSASPTVASSTVPALAAERAARGRSIIRPGGPRVWMVLGEDSLYRSSGGPDVLVRQLEHLRSLTRLPNIALRIVTRDAGNVAALSAGFTLLHTAEGLSFAYVTTPLKGDYVKAEETFTAIFENAWEHAASEAASAAILNGRISDHHDS
ncbi:DUF5753 domain-containing protein [Saccharothrix sp. BKS2]|uniref:DUF5753 domain-containing protein n=1 Tax=Saccharothrix sp. BKS2 TaxID=3064400 RepID=UPI0039ED09C5